MRYAVVSDIHANLQAWNAVLTDIATQRVDRILCLGDLVGYGPNPAEVLESAYRHVDAFCMGNHDAAVCGKLDTSLFNDHARRLITWTRTRLSDKAARFLASRPLMLTGPGFRCVHGDFTEPEAFNYIEDAGGAAPCWAAVTEQLLFAGHTHVGALFVIGGSGQTHALAPQDFVLEPGKRYLVNPGSAGNPRAGDALASYCIYDDAASSVVWRAVPFDLDACRRALQDAGFADADTHFLSLDARQHLTEVREAVSFSPARTASQKAHDVAPVGELARLSRTARRWKRIALTTGAMALIGITAAISISILRPPAGPLIVPASELPGSAPASLSNLLPSFPDRTADSALPGWRIRFDNPERTSITATEIDTVHTVTIRVAGAPARFRIESPPVRIDAKKTERFRLESNMHKAADFSGTGLFAIEQLGEPNGSRYPVLARVTKDPPPKRERVQFTTDAGKIMPGTHFVRLAIEGEHSGTATFEEPVLVPILAD